MPFARWENFGACKREMMDKQHHDEESAAKICGAIQSRAEAGALLKAKHVNLELLSKAGENDIILGGYASWAMEDDDGDFFTVESQIKALDRFFSLPPEYQLITVNHGRGPAGEINIAKPLLKYADSKGREYFSHVNEAGTYLICKLRNDDMQATRYYREKARLGELNGYSVNTFALAKAGGKVTDMEYSAITITEKGVMVPRNPRTRNVQVISKASESKSKEPIVDVESILQKYGFNKS